MAAEAARDESWKTEDDILAKRCFDGLEEVSLTPVSYLLGQTEADLIVLDAVKKRLATAERRGFLRYQPRADKVR
jgi:hypothetical protein